MSIKNKILLRKVLKYLVEGLAIAFVAFYIPRRKLKLSEILALSLTASTTLLILDTFTESNISDGTRFGVGFGVGADDYVTKPIKPKLLISRIQAILRRKNLVSTSNEIVIGDINIDGLINVLDVVPFPKEYSISNLNFLGLNPRRQKNPFSIGS